MELSKVQDTHPSEDVSHPCQTLIKSVDSDTPDSNKGLQDHDSATNSPKITKPVLGKAQAKKRLMAFANKFKVSPVLKQKEQEVNINKNQTISSFSVKKKFNIVKELMEVKDARNRIENEFDFQEHLNDTNTEKKNYKKHKKKSEPKISAIEEIIREESQQRMLLANIPHRIDDGIQRNERNNRGKNFNRFSQWGRKSQHNSRHSSSSNKAFEDRQYNDRRRHSSRRRDRSKSHDKKEESYNSDKRRSISPEINQKKIKSDKIDKSTKKNDKHRETEKGNSHKNNNKKERKNESYYPSNCHSWETFKVQGGRIRERSLSDSNYENTNVDVKLKTAEEYNEYLEQMLMMGSYRLERFHAIANGKNDEKKIYPPESVRVTKCKGSPLFYSENPEVALFLVKENLLQILPSDRCNSIKTIINDIKEIKMKEKNESINKREWFKKWEKSKGNDEKKICDETQPVTDQQEENVSSSPISMLPPKSKWDSEDELESLSKDNTSSDSQENQENDSEDSSSTTPDHKQLEPKKQIKEQSISPIPKCIIETDKSIKSPVAEKFASEITQNIDEINETNSPEVREKLISEYEQFIKIVSNNTEELENCKSQSPLIESVVISANESNNIKDVNDDKIVEKENNNDNVNSTNADTIKDDENIINIEEIKCEVEQLPYVDENIIIDKTLNHKHEENIDEKSNDSNWENIKNKVERPNEGSNRGTNKKDKKNKERKKVEIKRKLTSSESSDSLSSSSSNHESEKYKKKRNKKKKKSDVSSSESFSSESNDDSSSDNEDNKKRKKKNKKRSRKKSRTKKKRMINEENTDSESSYSDVEGAKRRKKRRRKDTSKHRKIIKRQSKSVYTKKLQKIKKEEKIELKEEILDESSLDKLKKTIISETNNHDKVWPKDTASNSQKPEEIEKTKTNPTKEKLNKINEKNSIKQTSSMKYNESTQPSLQNKIVVENADVDANINDCEKTGQNDDSKNQKLTKTKNKHRSSSTSSSSSISTSSSSSSFESNNKKRDKHQKKERSKRKSGDLSSRLMKKFRKYHSKLSSSLDFNALNFPSLTQLEQKISKNIINMDDWEVDSQDDNDEFIAKSKNKLMKKEKKVENEVRYDSKTDTYIAVEKKSQRENKKKQTGPVCALRIWEDEEEEGEREAMMLMKQKMETDSKLKSWEENVESTNHNKIIIPEKQTPVKSPIISIIKEEQSGWVEIIPEGGVKATETSTNQEIKKSSLWLEPNQDLKDDDEENLVPVNWEEEEVEWARTLPEKNDKNKLAPSKKSEVSSDSSSDSSDSSSSSDSSDSDEESSEPSRLELKTSVSCESPRLGIKSGPDELTINNSLEEPYAETEAMKKLRMNIFAEFAAKESRDKFSDQHDSLGSTELPLLVSKISSLPIPVSSSEKSRFAPRVHEIDSTAEREAIRRGFRDFAPKTDSKSSSHDSKRRFSPRKDRESMKIRDSEERGNNRSESRGSIRDSLRDQGRKDDRNMRGHTFEDERKYSPLNERNLREKRRSPVSWKDKSRSRSRSWSRSRSKSPHRKDDKSTWDRYKRSNYAYDRRERFLSRSPTRGRSPFRRDRERRSPNRDRSLERSRDRAWSHDKSADRSYDHLDSARNGYDIKNERENNGSERVYWREDNRSGKESSNVIYGNRPPSITDFNDRIYHRNNSLDRNIDNALINDSNFDKPRYRSRSISRSRSRSRERKGRDFDWDRSRESPEVKLDKFSSKNRKAIETRPRSRLSRSPVRFNRTRARSRSSSWSRSRTYSRSRSRSLSRNRSRSRSSSRSRTGFKNSDCPSRFRRSRSLSPHSKRFSRIDNNRSRRSTSRECGRRIETIIHPSGIGLIEEGSSNISQLSEANLPSVSAEFEYSYYQGNNLTYPPRLDNANSSIGSPKRLSLDDRLELELGIKKPHEPVSVPLPYNQPILSYSGVSEAPIVHPRMAASQSLSFPAPVEPITGPPGSSFHCSTAIPIIPSGPRNSLTPTTFNHQQPTVVQVGNVLQVVPGDFNDSLAPAQIKNGFPTPSLPGAPLTPESCNSNQVVRVGNVLQVVPTTTLDWSGRPTLSSGQPIMPTNTAHIAMRSPIPIVPYSVTPVLRPNAHTIPTIASPVSLRPQNKPVATSPLPIAILPKLEPPKAPPVIQPVYNYDAIMEARKKEREERKRIRAEKRLEKKRKKIEKLKRRVKRVQAETKTEDVKTEIINEDEPEPLAIIEEPEPGISETSDDLIPLLGESDQTTLRENEEEDDEEGDVEEDEDDIEFGNEEEVEDDMSKVMSIISHQVDAEIIKMAENPDAEIISNDLKPTVPLPSPPKKGILVPPGFWEEKFIHDESEEIMVNTTQENDYEELRLYGSELIVAATIAEDDNEIKSSNNGNDKENTSRTSRPRRTRKSVQFADGIRPGEGTSPSGCEGDLPSPPPPVPVTLSDSLHEQIKKSRMRKIRKKAKRIKPIKIKKKVKVKIIKLKKPKVTPLQAMMMEDSDEIDNRSPPPPPPGSPPLPHLWPNYLAAYSATLRPADTISPNVNQAPPPPTPLPLLVPPPPLNYTIQPFSKI